MDRKRYNHPDLQLGPQQADYIVGSDYTREHTLIIQNWKNHEIVLVEHFGDFLLPCAGMYGNQRLDRKRQQFIVRFGEYQFCQRYRSNQFPFLIYQIDGVNRFDAALKITE